MTATIGMSETFGFFGVHVQILRVFFLQSSRKSWHGYLQKQVVVGSRKLSGPYGKYVEISTANTVSLRADWMHRGLNVCSSYM